MSECTCLPYSYGCPSCRDNKRIGDLEEALRDLLGVHVDKCQCHFCKVLRDEYQDIPEVVETPKARRAKNNLKPRKKKA